MQIVLFAGTTEGRLLATFLAEHSVLVKVFVATEYGELVLPDSPYLQIHQGRLTADAMLAQMTKDTLVIDATHPYAKEVTANIRWAAKQTGAQYRRLIRPRITIDAPLITVPDVQAAAMFLNTVTGSALLTTGSKELEAFTQVDRYEKRLWPRVLPTSSVLKKCEELGYEGSHIIAMQGPFTHEMNCALLRQTKAKYLVTKDTGLAGGFTEKIKAAQIEGATVLLISRPSEEEGETLEQMQSTLRTLLGLQKESKQTKEKRFPLFVSLSRKKGVIFGAGKIAKRRAEILKDFGMDVQVIAPEARGILPDVYDVYQKSYLHGAFLVLACTDARAVNHQIAQDCVSEGLLCSVADCAEESTFFFPALCEGNGMIAGLISVQSDHANVAKMAEKIRKQMKEEEA